MKNKLTITGIFNDVFTNYENKEGSISMTVDTKENCTCYKENGRCLIHLLPKGYLLSDVDKKQYKPNN